MINTYIFSREKAEKYIAETNKKQNAAVISFLDPDYCDDRIDYSSIVDDVYYVVLPDIDEDELEDCGYTIDTYLKDADEIAAFIKKAHEEGKDIICQCEHGQSRSAACAAAIREFFFHDGIKIFADYRYYPNKLVFNKIFLALAEQK